MMKKIVKVAFCLSLLAGPAAFAQEEAEAPAAGTVQETTLWQMIQQGGWAMIPLGLMSTGMI